MVTMGRSPTNTKQKLIDTASELIWKNSFGSVSVDDICKAADVRKGSFYHYFPSKVSLAVAALEEFFINMRPLMDDIFSAARPPLERYEMLVEEMYNKQKEIADLYGRVCGCPYGSIGSEMAGQDEDIRKKTEELYERFERYHENALRDMKSEGLLSDTTDTKILAGKIQAYIMGIMMMARIQNDLNIIRRDLRDGVFRIIGVKQQIAEDQI